MNPARITAAVLLVFGLSTAAHAEMDQYDTAVKPDMVIDDFPARQAEILERLDALRSCIKAAKNNTDLKECNQKMVEKIKESSRKNVLLKCGGK